MTEKEAKRREIAKEVMTLAGEFVGSLTWSECLKKAWRNVKLRNALKKGVVSFRYKKVDGSTREAKGTLMLSMLPPTIGARRFSKSTQTYFDVEKNEWRCFKKTNLI